MAEYNPFTPDTPQAETTTRVRRLVTGVDEQGKSIFLDDSVVPGKVGHGIPTYVATDLWRTEQTPADNAAPYDDPARWEGRAVGPSSHGSVFRVLELPPDRDWLYDAEGNQTRPLAFHTTASIDYAIVLRGEVWAVMDADERLMRAGDVLVQRGTSHAWSNRSSEPCVLAFVLIGGTLPTPAPES